MSNGHRTEFDAIIVGAGPAGSAAAILLARAGWAVALVERQRFPRRKVCGECVAASNLPLLEALGVATDFGTAAGPELRRMTLMGRDSEVIADLPGAADERFRWGRALGRETLDTLLLAHALRTGAEIFQPWSLQAIEGTAGAWHCDLRSLESGACLRLHAGVIIDAHGSWEDLPSARPLRRLARSSADLFAFKANFRKSSLDAGLICVLALDGGYGGMVVADAGVTTVACCIRRDRLNKLRGAATGSSAGDAVEAWLQRQSRGVGQALHGAARDGPWLASGPLDPGVRIGPSDRWFRVGNAAGEAHPILGEGMSMALQSAALLCRSLLGDQPAAQAPSADRQAALQRRYAAAWRREFAPRLRLAAAFAHLAMRPAGTAALMALTRTWPALLSEGARWGGKVRRVDLAQLPNRALSADEKPPKDLASQTL